MNERIKELVKQAGGHFSTHTLTSYPAQHRESIELWDKNIEKFAELIVRECIDKCEFVANMATITNTGEMARKTKATADSCATMIKEHFGVEE